MYFKDFEKEIKKHGLQTMIDIYQANNWEIPNPKGYNSVSLANTIGVWYPWVKSGYKTVLNPIKLGMIEQYAKIAPSGAFYELGVYTGGVTRLLLDMGYKVTCFDTFKGVKGITDDKYFNDGMYNGGNVSDYIKEATIVTGKLPETLSVIMPEDIAFIHFDLDVYKPTKDSLDILWPRVVKDGIVIFDDYGTWATEGVKRAVDEFKYGKKIYLPTGQMVITK